MDVTVSQVISSSRALIYAAVIDGTVFALTGASSISADARIGGGFRLGFDGRGTVSGEFLELLIDERVRLSWHVAGFGRPAESTIVEIAVAATGSSSAVVIHHSGIAGSESAAAKTRAWSAILAGLERSLAT